MNSWLRRKTELSVSKNGSVVESESFLLQPPNPQSGSHGPSYDSIHPITPSLSDSTAEIHIGDGAGGKQTKCLSCDSTYFQASFITALMAVAIVSLLFILPRFPMHENTADSFNCIPQNVAAIDPSATISSMFGNTTTNNVTFRELARFMVPRYYASMIPALELCDETVMPSQVGTVRKIILGGRNLLDVFSPVYPNTSHEAGRNGDEFFHAIRHHLALGYRTIGDFLDLHNAHINYSIKELETKRETILEWKKNFEVFRRTNDVPAFLTAASPQSFRHHESHFFWKNIHQPHGNAPANDALGILGSHQLEMCLQYLDLVHPFNKATDKMVHEHFHNLRKQLRALCDEYLLFGTFMYPSSTKTDSAIRVLEEARLLLGDINDKWTARALYMENKEFPDEIKRLGKEINHSWRKFKRWTLKVDFIGNVWFLVDSMKQAGSKHMYALDEFLKLRKARPTQHVVIGNEAGDADSVISAITLAAVESLIGQTQSTPIVSISKADLATQRPEIVLLLHLAGISNPIEDLLFVDDPPFQAYGNGTNVTLVDHNILDGETQNKTWTVVEIVDHHADQGLYIETCHESQREIAFAGDEATVSSTCTLVAERLRKLWKLPYPGSLGILLLGVILLDSVNLSPLVGKVTQRDKDAVQDLAIKTDWKNLKAEAQEILNLDTSSRPNTTSLFRSLQDAKYDPVFWDSLSVRDALRLDYKEFCSREDCFGISTILMSLKAFLKKKDPIDGILQYMSEVRSDKFLGIMSAYYEEKGYLHRQLALCGTAVFPMDELVHFLLYGKYEEESPELVEIDRVLIQEDPTLKLRLFDQENIKPSRKQIGPILIHFFEMQ